MEFVVVQVIQGKKLLTDRGELQIQVRWGEEEATMEPVCSEPNVVIQQEVAFEISKDDDRIFNMIPLSLQCTYFSPKGTKCYIGKVDLPVNLTADSDKKWFKLSTVYESKRLSIEPSLLISTFCEHSNEQATRNEDKGIILIEEPKPPHEEKPRDVLKPVLIDDEYFLLEDLEDTSEQIFHNMSITLSFAENLFSLFPSQSLWPPENMPFEFRFKLMGSPIHFQPFNCLRNLTEIGERATAKIKCSSKCLLRFLKESMQTLSILLFCEDIPIAESVIPIKERIESCQLEPKILKRLHLEPVNISGIFPLLSLLETESNRKPSSLMKPQIGLTIVLSQAIPQATNPSPSPSPARIPSSFLTVSSEPGNINEVPDNLPSLAKRLPEEKTQEELLYATALELEVWKEEQKLLEQEKQERSRASYMDLLNNEYCRQAALKEAALHRRIRRVEDLEKQLEGIIQTARQSELDLQQERERYIKQRSQLTKDRKIIDTEVERVTHNLTTKHKFELESERRRHTEIVTELRRKLKAEMQKSSVYSEQIKELEDLLRKLKST